MAFLSMHMMLSQNITGKLVDKGNHPLVGANVLLLSKADSTYIAGTITDSIGTFKFAPADKGGILMFSYLGYHRLYYPLVKNDVGVIQMEEDVRMLNSVTISANRIINNAQGYSIHPAGSGLENCNTPQELFAFLPGISVTENQIKLLDKLPVVYVNGIKITSQDELESLNPKRIEHIEVDYLAIGEGATEKGGVIRITTKREKDGGYSGYLRAKSGIMASYGYNSASPAFVMDASIGKWTFNYYAVYSNKQLLEDATNNYSYNSGKSANIVSKTRSWMNDFSNRLNISYALNDRSTLAVSEYVGNMHIKNRQSNIVMTFVGDEQEMQENDVLLHGPENQLAQQTVAKYILQTDNKGSNLEITSDYLFQHYKFKQYEDINHIGASVDSTREKTNMFRFNSKYTHKFIGGYELKAGVDYQYISHHDKTDGLTNNADAHIPSAYVNFSGRVQTLMYSAGLTFQYNRMEVRTAGEATLFNKAYLCPQANLMWMINPKRATMLALMYQCTVSDMPYSVINGYKKYSTPYHYTTGNPSLRTPQSHELMARFALNRHIAAMFMYARESDPIYYEHGTDEQNENITWSRPENGDYRKMLGVRVELTFTPTKWWSTKIQAAAMQDKLVTETETLKGQWGGKFWWDNQFNFTSTFGGSLNGYWETGTSFENYHWSPVGNFNASLWISFCKDKLRLSLQSTIWGRGRESRTTSDDYTSYYVNATKPTSFLLTVTWSFSGGKKVKQRSEAVSIQQYNQIQEKK